ncbi:hypothetical protein FHS89_001961 [Rubricella aquisinus]|uniref:AAA+ ATPase domain-containing protein n=1 Tax=Rubricella aquisinus TaxID=2028108 RepID=A0A840WMY0_9RHOB|nr:ATPase [Rubricella aquisinus]MBB5515941.1 hypothetical protein [Rubricella aquisinus]
MTSVPAPKAPTTVAETGIAPTLLRDLLLKAIFRLNLTSVSDMSKACAVTPPVIEDLVQMCRDGRLIETLGMKGEAGSELRYQLTDTGRARALDALAQSEYAGAFPVSLDAFTAQSSAQSLRNSTITRDALEKASAHLILPKGLLENLGPAVNSGRSILLYGPPGNGKSVLSSAIRDALTDHVYIPRVLEVGGQMIAVFDPSVHRPITDPVSEHGLRRSDTFDQRYVKCRRPTVITGGELTIDMLDLGFNPMSRTYQAPLQLKATGGIFIVDDLGRQREAPQALMNRWIVPIEEQFDLLSLQSGQKFRVPFDTLVIFSTNFAPKKLFDGAALRRIYYKIRIDGPSRDDFIKIFLLVARQYKMKPDETTLAHLIRKLYPSVGAPFASFHAPFLIDQMASICAYEGIAPQMSVPLIERAWANLFVADEENTL